MTEQPTPQPLDPAEEFPEFIEATATDVAGQPDPAVDQSPYADGEDQS